MKKKNSPIKNFKPDILPFWPQKMKLSKTQKEIGKNKDQDQAQKDDQPNWFHQTQESTRFWAI